MTDVIPEQSFGAPVRQHAEVEQHAPVEGNALASERLLQRTWALPKEKQSDVVAGKLNADTKLISDYAMPVPTMVHGQVNNSALFRHGINAHSMSDLQLQGPAPSLLEAGIDKVTSNIVSNKETRDQVNHYTAEFLKTASLFAKPKVGVASAAVLYGFDNVKTDQDLTTGSIDFALGGAKGATVRSLFTWSSKTFKLAPTKGIALGVISRDAEIVFSREMVNNPSGALAKLKQETVNPTLWAYDGAVFIAGEGMFGVANRMTGRALSRSQLASGMAMGGSFGIVNGGSGEIIRQQNAGEKLDIGKVLHHAALDGGVGALGAGFGIKASDPRFYANMGQSISNIDVTAKNVLISAGLKQQPGLRTFEVIGDRNSLLKFQNNEIPEATTQVRELKKVLFFDRKGPEQTLIVSHKAPLLKPGEKLDPAKCVLANCNPERLNSDVRAAHAFPESKGPVWLDLGLSASKLRLLSENTYKLEPGTYKPLGTMTKLGRPEITMNVMAPLAVGNLENPNDPNSKSAWESFERDLANAKKIGVDGVSTDVWWGLVEPKPGQYNWKYYDQLSQRIKDHGLKWVPILALHQCGGNVGDNVYVPLPFWVWNHVAAKAGSNNPDFAKYQSEQGNKSSEYVSVWATEHALPRYRSLMESFQNHFANRRNDIAEINVSLGPAGELRYPSYNAHDQNSGYPTRGALQSYSEVAVKSFQDYAIKKYGSPEKVKEVWGTEYGADITPPKNPGEFLARNKHHETQYGRDYFDWYNHSLLNHGKQVLNTALDVFGTKNAPFHGIDIGAKMPGIHWRVGERQGENVIMGDRLAELAAGLITTSRGDWNADPMGRGYRPILEMFRDVQRPGSKSKVVPHFTALEIPDGHEGPSVKSMPYALGTWVGQESARQGLTLKGENALSWNLHDHGSWDRMRSFIDLPGNQNGYYHGLTILRMSDVVNSDLARARMEELIQAVRARNAESAREAK